MARNMEANDFLPQSRTSTGPSQVNPADPGDFHSKFDNDVLSLLKFVAIRYTDISGYREQLRCILRYAVIPTASNRPAYFNTPSNTIIPRHNNPRRHGNRPNKATRENHLTAKPSGHSDFDNANRKIEETRYSGKLTMSLEPKTFSNLCNNTLHTYLTTFNHGCCSIEPQNSKTVSPVKMKKPLTANGGSLRFYVIV